MNSVLGKYRMNILDIQRLLMAAGYYNGLLDSDYGPKTKQAVSQLLNSRQKELPNNWKSWGDMRKGIAAGQLVLKYAGFDEVGPIDGLAGPSTKYALGLYAYQEIHGHRPKEQLRADERLLVPHPEEGRWPYQNNLHKYFGIAGGPQCTAGKVSPPFKMKLAWNLRHEISRFSCHERVADSAQKVYDKIGSAYSLEDISKLGFNLFGGCYNYRKKRGGSSLSTHAYGIAIDTDPERNQMPWSRDRSRLAKEDCEEFWKCWESEGWISLGRSKNFDWMHVQAARI